MERREFIMLLLIGYLDQGPSEDAPELVAAFREASQEKSEQLKRRKVPEETIGNNSRRDFAQGVRLTRHLALASA
jgi:hypothetical protein